MRKMLFAAALALAGCSVPVDMVDAATAAPGPGTYALAVDPAFTTEERDRIGAALQAVDEWTDGTLRVVMVDAEGDAVLLRGGVDTGGYSRPERTLRVNPEHLADYDDGLRAMTASLVVRFAGMKMHDDCGLLGRECVRFDFTQADRTSCRDGGFCR